MGWKLQGAFPLPDKCVIIVVPHTSWVDFALGLLIRKVMNLEIHYIGKKSLFNPPFGWFFRWTGGVPIDRSKANNTVSATVQIFTQRKVFRLALSPEGTRKKVTEWRTGFYHIAKEAAVPIVLVAFDFGKRQITISEPQAPTSDQRADFETYTSFFKGVQGRIPENSF